MALPKKLYVNIVKNNIGEKRLAELLESTDKKTTNLPKGVSFRDIDDAVFDLVKNKDLKFIDRGNEIPTFFLTPERWAEFSKTWVFVDKDKNIEFPFITVKRISKGKGTYTNLNSTVPQNKVFQYGETVELDGDTFILKKYLIPQPTAVDLGYSVKLFTKHMLTQNNFDQLLFKKYASTQLYINVKGHYFETQIESSDDGGEQENIDGDKFHVSNFNIMTKGYIIDEDDFKITQTKKVSRLGIIIE